MSEPPKQPPVDSPTETPKEKETLEQAQTRHRKEQRDLQARITNKKKNATKKTRKFVNDECVELERALKERQEGEVRGILGEGDTQDDGEQGEGEDEDGVDGLAGKLASTTLSHQPPSSSSQPPQPSAPQPQASQAAQQKPKRNRQKDRLARRAAETQAAIDQAAQEAAAMPDRRTLEKQAMQRVFGEHGLREKEIAPDGHCLFSAVADQLGVIGLSVVSGGKGDGSGGGDSGDGVERGEEKQRGAEVKQPPYKLVRKAAAEYIDTHKDEYAGFLEDGVQVDEYVARIRDTAEWGGQLELSALANVYGVEIRVVQGQGRVEVVKPTTGEVPGGTPEEGKAGEKGQERKTVWLAYYRHGYGLGEHYNSLRKEV
ncbi:uncharacterized protein C8A04DRAFT_11633 [Dichotomopilus funicola]|uniref:OTU domain-containing protein n=1 Tax=Dichotomopilus funicola TaxID=1934379 RepID=A0AAN6V5C1_9PEZI|nr:hypothetical protein C8A04DRAFT_11633 [Dichotomopilus funicola]